MSTRDDDQVHNLMMLALHGHPQDFEDALRAALGWSGPDRTDIALAEIQRTLVNIDPRTPLSAAIDVVTRMRRDCRDALDSRGEGRGDETEGNER